MKKMRSILYVLLISFLFWQCSSDGYRLEKVRLSGSAVKGPVVSADVTVYAYDGSGTRGEVLVTTTTDQSGNFSVEIDHRGVVEVVVTGGNYRDEATGRQVSLNAFELRNIINVDGNENFGVTALTTIAAEHIDEHAADGLNTAIENANRAVADAFGLTGIDISSVIPADLSLPGAAGANLEQIQYGAVQAGLSEFVRSSDFSPEALLELIDAMRADFSDGTFDGRSGGEALEFVLTITPEEALNGLETAKERVLAKGDAEESQDSDQNDHGQEHQDQQGDIDGKEHGEEHQGDNGDADDNGDDDSGDSGDENGDNDTDGDQADPDQNDHGQEHQDQQGDIDGEEHGEEHQGENGDDGNVDNGTDGDQADPDENDHGQEHQEQQGDIDGKTDGEEHKGDNGSQGTN